MIMMILQYNRMIKTDDDKNWQERYFRTTDDSMIMGWSDFGTDDLMMGHFDAILDETFLNIGAENG